MGADGYGSDSSQGYCLDAFEPPRPMRGRTPGRDSDLGEATASDGFSSLPGEVLCNVCGKGVSTFDIVWKGNCRTPYHRDCMNAEAYFERHARQKIGADALMRYKTERPREFRYKIAELLTGDSNSSDGGAARRRRGIEERAKTAALIEEIDFYSRCYRQQYVFMLGEAAYKQWFLRGAREFAYNPNDLVS